MGRKTVWKVFVLLCICLVCLFSVRRSGQAEESGEGTEQAYEEEFRTFFERKAPEGAYFGVYKECFYTYRTDDPGEVKIIGIKNIAKSVTIPSKINGKRVTEIDLITPDYNGYMLAETKVRSITISKYIENIPLDYYDQFYTPKNFDIGNGSERYSFNQLPYLEKIVVSSKNKYYMAKDGVLFSKNGKTLVCVPHNKKGKTYQIPKGVKKIANGAFALNDKIKKVVLPNTVKVIGNAAFQYSSLSKISLPKNLKIIGSHAFDRTDIKNIAIPQKVREIPGGCFINCDKLRKIIIPPSVKKMDEDAFVTIYSHGGKPKINLTIYAKKKSYAYWEGKGWKKYGIKVEAL